MRNLTLSFLALVTLLFWAKPSYAQLEYKGPYKMVFQLTTNDTLAHKALMKQIANITSVEPKTQIEVVCHGPGLAILHNKKSIVANKVKAFTQKGVTFSACEFSMQERNVNANEIIEGAKFVKAGIIHIVNLQANGWYYVKAGF